MAIQSSVLFGIFYITSSYINKFYQLYWVIATLLICAVSESILAILQHFSPNFYLTHTNVPRDPYALSPREYFGYIFPFVSKYVREARGTFGQLNGLGNFLSFFSPLAFALALIQETNVKRKMVLGVVNVTIFLGLYFSYSRGSLIGVLVGLLVIILLLIRKGRRKELRIGVILLILSVISISLHSLSGVFIEYWNATQTLTTRLQYWDETLTHIVESPSVFLFGTHYFLNADEGLFQELLNWTPLGHNSYLAVWESRGLIGVILLLLIIVFSIKSYYSSYRKTRNVYIRHVSIGMIGGLVAFSISQCFDHKLAYFFDIRIFVFIIVGMSIGTKRIVEGVTRRT
jgi:O-antigen ligase